MTALRGDSLVDAMLRAWGRVSRDHATIRGLTGCGPGPLTGRDKAGPSSVMGRLITDAVSQPQQAPDVPLMSDDVLVEIDNAINTLTPRLRQVIHAEYRGSGTQASKAHRLGITLVNYRVSLMRGRQAVADALGLSM